jgi:hypothetical protein
MFAGRTILALAIAFSVAVLPATGCTARPAQSATASMSVDCDHHGAPVDKATKDDQALATCALKCFNFCGTMAPILILPATATAVQPLRSVEKFPSQPAHPPFRPPRA